MAFDSFCDFINAINTLGSHKRMAMSMGADSVD